ncbi:MULTISPECIES: hypothetical protein [unclassified Nostoc]|uniref:hypothetical protein n=1 Tax=Nostoc sp. S13 TaxID=3019266 RepID=UPI0026173A10|nr:hypothetical protein [Nostoc sp. S13]MDF5737444.1 hypothetical protein [Nostoc sp. S13]
MANLLYWIPSCYRNLKNYTKAIEYYQQSRNFHQHLGHDESEATRCMQLGNSQRLLAKNSSDRAVAFELLSQAEQNILQAIQISTTGDYKENLAYDYIVFSLIGQNAYAYRLLTTRYRKNKLPNLKNIIILA